MIRAWPKGRLPYEVDEALPKLSRRRLRRAIDRWNDSGVPVTVQPRQSRDSDYLIFRRGLLSSSPRGWLGGGAQVITVSRDASYGVIMHEIGHVAGLTHEHNRPDRDEWIEVVLANIHGAALSQFQRRDDPVPSRGYDYGSIMHYAPMAFSNNDQPTIRILGTIRTGVLVGQRRALSDGDVAHLHELYDGPGSSKHVSAAARKGPTS